MARIAWASKPDNEAQLCEERVKKLAARYTLAYCEELLRDDPDSCARMYAMSVGAGGWRRNVRKPQPQSQATSRENNYKKVGVGG